jgi:hypothetical protein
MTRNRIKEKNGSILTLAELLLVVAVVWFLAYNLLKLYTKKPIRDEQAANFVASQGIDTASPGAILNTTRDKLQDISRQVKQRENELENTQ